MTTENAKRSSFDDCLVDRSSLQSNYHHKKERRLGRSRSGIDDGNHHIWHNLGLSISSKWLDSFPFPFVVPILERLEEFGIFFWNPSFFIVPFDAFLSQEQKGHFIEPQKNRKWIQFQLTTTWYPWMMPMNWWGPATHGHHHVYMAKTENLECPSPK